MGISLGIGIINTQYPETIGNRHKQK